jgi:tetratricopeptide (TPR) repeat protein
MKPRPCLGRYFLPPGITGRPYLILESVKEMNPEIKAVYQKIAYYRAEELMLNKDIDSARIYFLKSLTYPLDKKNTGTKLLLAGREINYRNGKYDDAVKNFNSFLAREDSKQSLYYFTAYYNLGYSWFSQKNYKNAVLNFKKYLELDSYFKSPELYLDAMMRSGDANYVLKNYDAAIDAYQYVISKGGEWYRLCHLPESNHAGIVGKECRKGEHAQADQKRFRLRL